MWVQPVAAAENSAWSAVVEQYSSGIVSLSVDVTRSFDTEANQSSQATGFIVDAERGLILTNRHVVTPGPVRAEALFLNQEEVPLTAVYRGCIARVRAVCTTSFTTLLGLVPMILSSGPGAEIQRPLAGVVLGGMTSALVLVLIVLPALYVIVDPHPPGDLT